MTIQTTSYPAVEAHRSAASLPSNEALLRRRLLAVLETPVEPLRLTYDEFLAWADEDTLAEWVDGEVIMTSPASRQHQTIADFLLKVMGTIAENRQLGVVISAPFQMKIERSGREPDVMFVANEHLDRFRENHLEGPADLVVEIISPESIGRDRGEKFTEYEAAGVPEFWLIDPLRRWSEVYRLEEGRFHPIFSDASGICHSQSLPGFWLRMEWLWQSPPPQLLDVLAELEIV